MKKVIVMICCMLLWGAEAQPACIASITASTPSTDFINHGDGTVTHIKTGLMWKRCSEGVSGADCTRGVPTRYTWQGALAQAAVVNGAGFAGFNDWRVPNIKELHSIVETQCGGPSINTAIFPAASWKFWSSSPLVGNASTAWTVNFTFGRSTGDGKSLSYSVRLVRGGQ